ncbi:mitochondrial chaperone Frataxin [Xylariaceae sp. FL0662B]|nr:mitochondrial chaperone Frataxin [Xylariaceae sp. FL0662B]
MITRRNLVKLGRLTTRAYVTRAVGVSSPSRFAPFLTARSPYRQPISKCLFSTSHRCARPLSPEVLKTIKPAPMSDAEYHELADDYLEMLLLKYEELQDERGDIDVEYSSGVMTVKIPNAGTYVLNKQPPNKQIWLSSPRSGPKRYDYVVLSEGQHQKQETGRGGWVYLRDGSSLDELLYEETGVVTEEPAVDKVE